MAGKKPPNRGERKAFYEGSRRLTGICRGAKKMIVTILQYKPAGIGSIRYWQAPKRHSKLRVLFIFGDFRHHRRGWMLLAR
ncbi:hypothetical protein B2D07_19945 [Desulfococcus multivorans]|nr:hypothetical protein B2D07_19945 [Desulfococcus multivorans]